MRIKRGGNKAHPHDYVQIVESYRDGGRPKQRVLANLGRYDELVASGELAKLAESLQRAAGTAQVLQAAREPQVAACQSREWGPALVFGRLWERQGLPAVLNTLADGRRFEFPVERMVFTLALQRLCRHGSDLFGSDWIHTVAAPGTEGLRLQHFYRTCGFLLDVRQRLERRLYLRDRDLLFMQLNPVLIDTLTYKSLWRVERVFREEKPTLEVRPIFHHRDDTSIGHIVASFLALRLEVDLHHRRQGPRRSPECSARLSECPRILLRTKAAQIATVGNQ